MKWSRFGISFFLFPFSFFLALAAAPATPPIKPGDPVDCRAVAFDPAKWEKKNLSLKLVPWTGQNVVLLTTTANHDPAVMGQILARLDGGWKLYADLTGKTPGVFKQINGKPTINAIPDGSLTCGYGCGYIGVSGIEVAGFYGNDYPMVAKDPEAFPHYYFYEMGRNYYTFGDRHSAFITGYAVFMRYVCMDDLKCKDTDAGTRKVIEQAEELLAESDMPFLKAFTTLDGLDEKAPRLKDVKGPSDQPVIYASAMLKLHRELGGDEWLRRFYAALRKCPSVAPRSKDAALAQSTNWLIAASAAARKDLSPVFADRWRLPLRPEARKVLADTAWKSEDLDVGKLCERMAQVGMYGK
ncbi:MAG: calcium-binding protein [Tepidisphaerales bacterium]